VRRDLDAVREQLAINPQFNESAVKETYMRMVFLRNEVIKAARMAEKASDKAKLYGVVGKIDAKILERFTLPGMFQIQEELPQISDNDKIMVDWILLKFGPEVLEELIAYIEQHRNPTKFLERSR